MATFSWKVAAVLAGAVASVPAPAASVAGSVHIRSDTTPYLVTARHSGKCLDLDNGSPQDGTPIIQWSCHGGANQQWRLVLRTPGAVGTYFVISVQTGKCMAVAGRSVADGADVVQLPCDAVADRLWQVSEVTAGYLRFVAVISGKCLDVRDVSRDDGARIQQWSCHDGGNQQWRIREAT